jgi:nucleoid DNA-binding protein
MTKKIITKNIKQNIKIKDHDALKITDAFFKIVKLNLHNSIVKFQVLGVFIIRTLFKELEETQ